MPALTATSWTVVQKTRKIAGTERIVKGTMAIPGVDTYPAGGIPLPTAQALGLIRNLTALILHGHAAATTAYGHEVDLTNSKLQLYEEEAVAAGGPLLEADTAEVPGPRTWEYEARGW